MFNWYRGSFPMLKHHGIDADFASPSGVKFRNEWSCTTTPSIRLHGERGETLTFIDVDVNQTFSKKSLKNCEICFVALIGFVPRSASTLSPSGCLEQRGIGFS